MQTHSTGAPCGPLVITTRLVQSGPGVRRAIMGTRSKMPNAARTTRIHPSCFIVRRSRPPYRALSASREHTPARRRSGRAHPGMAETYLRSTSGVSTRCSTRTHTLEQSRDLDGNRLAATGRARDKGHFRDVVDHSGVSVRHDPPPPFRGPAVGIGCGVPCRAPAVLRHLQS